MPARAFFQQSATVSLAMPYPLTGVLKLLSLAQTDQLANGTH